MTPAVGWKNADAVAKNWRTLDDRAARCLLVMALAARDVATPRQAAHVYYRGHDYLAHRLGYAVPDPDEPAPTEVSPADLVARASALRAIGRVVAVLIRAGAITVALHSAPGRAAVYLLHLEPPATPDTQVSDVLDPTPDTQASGADRAEVPVDNPADDPNTGQLETQHRTPGNTTPDTQGVRPTTEPLDQPRASGGGQRPAAAAGAARGLSEDSHQGGAAAARAQGRDDAAPQPSAAKIDKARRADGRARAQHPDETGAQDDQSPVDPFGALADSLRFPP